MFNRIVRMICFNLKDLIVVALGGNAIKKEGEDASVEVQVRNITNACIQIIQIIKKGYRVILTHGNGPQVGNLLLMQEATRNSIAPLPLDLNVARTQGGLGYLLQRTLRNELAKEQLSIPVVSLVAQVRVERTDPSFKDPSKPIGPFYTKEEAQELGKMGNFVIKEVKKNSDKAYRRVVPSPQPLEILDKEILQKLVDSGYIVIACGGGGIPVSSTEGKDNVLEGVEAVIDKDLTAELLGRTLGADTLLILTDVDKVKLNYASDQEIDLDELTLDEAMRRKKDGHFLSGSMGPKVEACIRFLQNGGKKAVIGSLEKALSNLDGKTGTTFYKFRTAELSPARSNELRK